MACNKCGNNVKEEPDLQRQLQQAREERDREASYAADLEAALACDTCKHPLNHIEHLERDAAEQRASTIRVGEALMLAYANVGQDNWDKMDGGARQAINVGVAEWNHLVAPAEALRTGQEEGDECRE